MFGKVKAGQIWTLAGFSCFYLINASETIARPF